MKEKLKKYERNENEMEAALLETKMLLESQKNAVVDKERLLAEGMRFDKEKDMERAKADRIREEREAREAQSEKAIEKVRAQAEILRVKESVLKAEAQKFEKQKDSEKAKAERIREEREKCRFLMNHPRLANDTTYTKEDILRVLGTTD